MFTCSRSLVFSVVRMKHLLCSMLGTAAWTRRATTRYVAKVRNVWVERIGLCNHNARLWTVHGDQSSTRESFLLFRISLLNTFAFLLAARTTLSSFRSVQIRQDNGKSRCIYETIQRNTVLDCHRSLSNTEPGKTCSTAEKIHQTGLLVRTTTRARSPARSYSRSILAVKNIEISILSLPLSWVWVTSPSVVYLSHGK